MNWRLFFVAIRWQNVFIIGIMQSLILFLYVLPACSSIDFPFLSGILLILATGLVLSGGNIYNDLRDIDTDALHPGKPSIIGHEVSIDKARIWILSVNVISLVIVMAGYRWFHWHIALPIIFLVTIPVLILYAHFLKSTLLVGNLTIAVLCAVAIWMTSLVIPNCVIPLDLFTNEKYTLIVSGFVLNAFLLTLLREIVKDKEDAAYDVEAGIITVGSVEHLTFRRIVNTLCVTTIIINLFWMTGLMAVLSPVQWTIGLVLIFGPLAALIIFFNFAGNGANYRLLSQLIKLYFLCAMLLLILWH